MFIEVHANRETIVLTAVGSDEMSLLRKMADGVHVQAFDDSKDYKKIIVLAPVLLAKVGLERERDIELPIGKGDLGDGFRSPHFHER